MRLNEAFKALNALTEETFSVSDDGINKLAQFENDDDMLDELSVIDLDAETEDDFQDSYVGKVILDCCVCHSKLYKNKEDVTIDEESDLANVGEDCPYCYTPDGFKVIGEVAPYNETSTDDSNDVAEDDEVEVEDTADDIDEGLFDKKKTQQNLVTVDTLKKGQKIRFTKNGKSAEGTIKEIHKPDNTQFDARIILDNGADNTFQFEDKVELVEGLFDKKKNKKNQKPELKVIEASQLVVGDSVLCSDGSMGEIVKIEEAKNGSGYIILTCADGEELDVYKSTKVKAYHNDNAPATTKNKQTYNATKDSSKLDKKLGVRSTSNKTNGDAPETEKNEGLNENINNITLDTDDTHMEMKSDESGKVTVTTEPKTDGESLEASDAEMIVPVSPETEQELTDNNDELDSEDGTEDEETVSVEIDDFDEDSFNELGEQYLREAYNNVETFKTRNVTETKEGLLIEGVIKFTSGNDRLTSFLFTSHNADRQNRVTFLGENLELNTGKRAYKVNGFVKDNKLFLESLSYNYKASDETGKTNRIHGFVERG